jgi:hypothetical protein
MHVSCPTPTHSQNSFQSSSTSYCGLKLFVLASNNAFKKPLPFPNSSLTSPCVSNGLLPLHKRSTGKLIPRQLEGSTGKLIPRQLEDSTTGAFRSQNYVTTCSPRLDGQIAMSHLPRNTASIVGRARIGIIYSNAPLPIARPGVPLCCQNYGRSTTTMRQTIISLIFSSVALTVGLKAPSWIPPGSLILEQTSIEWRHLFNGHLSLQ